MFTRRSLEFAPTVALLAGLLALAGTAGAQDPPEALVEAEQFRRTLFDRVAPSVVFISREKGIGSGFFVDDSGLVLTNAHVVEGADKLTVILHDGTQKTAEVVERADDDVDLALMRVPDVESEPLQLGGVDALRVGNWAAVVGHGMGGAWTFTTGIVTNIYPSKSDRPIFQTQIPLNPGASGGPVLDRKGRVIGVATAKITNADNVNFAIRIDVARDSLEELPEFGEALVVHAPEGVPVFVDGTMQGTGPEVRVHPSDGEHEVFVVVDGTMRKKLVSFPETKNVDLTQQE